MFNNLKDKKVLVTGASSGIGACTARLFAHYGSIVGIHYNANRHGAEAVLNQIMLAGGEAYLIHADLLKKKERNRVIDLFIRDSGGIDVLINNAGTIFGNEHFLVMKDDEWRDTIDLNLTAPYFLAKQSFEYMMKYGGGKIINISSISAKYGGSEKSIHYGAAKAGLDAITRTLSRAGAPFNILVNSIQPGVIQTDAHRKIGRLSLDDRIKKIPLKRAGTPRDVAQLCVFLGSEAGDYITGQIIGVTGGD
ncbi:MAG: SDR family NAD(P)-dependent oxidoreductase [Methanoregulaceae archaeon]|jgi:3-oxoacyl-[acyl-carrier protein] reductase